MSISNRNKKGQFIKGHKTPFTQEHRNNLSLSLKGKKLSEEHRLKISAGKLKNPTRYWLGKKRPNISKGNHYLWKTDRDNMCWKHSLRGTVEWKNWRDEVFIRDNYTCRDCGIKGEYLEPHHIIPIRLDKTQIFNIRNGITLCRRCHKKTIRKELNFAEKYTALVMAQ